MDVARYRKVQPRKVSVGQETAAAEERSKAPDEEIYETAQKMYMYITCYLVNNNQCHVKLAI